MEPFIGEIRIMTGNVVPNNWALCNGQSLLIMQYPKLYSIIGTMYGGDGMTTFALPNLQGRTPIGVGRGRNLTPRPFGESGGAQTVTLTVDQLPMHNHIALCASQANTASPDEAIWATAADERGMPSLYSKEINATMAPFALTPTGGSQPHNNMQPYLCVNFMIALEGIYPARD